MPTYEFRCPTGHEFERFFRKISEAAAETVCPVCGLMAARRMSGGAGLVFKGSGFYATDYARPTKKEGVEVEASSDGASEKPGGESSKSTGKAKKPVDAKPPAGSEKATGSKKDTNKS